METQKFGNLEYHTNPLGRIVVEKQISDQKLCVMIFVMSRDRWIVDETGATSLNDIKYPKLFLNAQIEALDLMEHLNILEEQNALKNSAINNLIASLGYIAEEFGFALPKTDAAYAKMQKVIREWHKRNK